MLPLPDFVAPIQRAFLDAALPRLHDDPRLLGVAIGGARLLGSMDPYSDLDLVIAVDPDAYPEVMTQRAAIAGGLGRLLSSFTGEHVGEPRLLVCLYGPPLVHVDLKFVSLDDLHRRVETPHVLWERGGAMSAAFALAEAEYPQPDLQWIEDRFWVWMHYLAAHLGRGEMYEVIDGLAFIRAVVLGPLLAVRAGAQPRGVRRLEGFTSADEQADLARTLGGLQPAECAEGVRAAARLYAALRAALAAPGFAPNADTEREALFYLDQVARRR